MRPLRLLLFSAVLLAVAAYGGCAPERTDGDDPPAVAAEFVGDEACGTCHGDFYTSNHASGMGRSVSLFDPATAPERFDPDGHGPVVCHAESGFEYVPALGNLAVVRAQQGQTAEVRRLLQRVHTLNPGDAQAAT